MITLDRKGHWYRYFDKWNYQPNNLCQLFWTGLLLPLLHIVVGTLFVLLIAYSLLGWGHVIALFFGIPWPFAVQTITALVTLLIALEGMILALTAIIFLIAGTSTFAKAVRHTSPAEVAAEAYRGLKDKYCPLVEWE